MDPRMLEPGWAGPITLEQAEAIRDALDADDGLRRRWRLPQGAALTKVAAKANPQDPHGAVATIRRQQAVRRVRKHRQC